MRYVVEGIALFPFAFFGGLAVGAWIKRRRRAA